MSKVIISIAVFFLFAHCRKKEKDEITQHNIKGMVYNNCTDSGLANVTVYLKDGQGLNLSTVSDAGGNFIFPAVTIHSSSKYTYNIYIPSKSGDNATTFEYCRFIGTTLLFNYNEAGLFFKPRVQPGCLFYKIFCTPIPITNATDSIRYHIYQYTLHKNVPEAGYTMGGGGYGSGITWGNFGGYPMGKHIIEMDIWRNGVNTTKKDSVYLSWGADKTYTINW